MSISALFNGISGFFVQIGDFFVMLWGMLVSHIELFGRYVKWLVTSIPELLSFVTQGFDIVSNVLLSLPSPIVTGIRLCLMIPFAVMAVKVVSKL